MSSNGNKNSGNKNQNSNKGFFSGLLNAAKNATNKATQAVTGNKPNSKNNNGSKNSSEMPVATTANNGAAVKPAANGVNIPIQSNNTAPKPTQNGGVASVNASVPPGQRQPSEEIMEWATTAGVPTPTGPQMRGVAQGGSRRNRTRRNRN